MAMVIPAQRSASEVLSTSRDLVDPALRTAVDSLPASIRFVAGYHFGWWDQYGTPGAAGSGKALRPALVLLAAEAVGGDTADAIPAAAAVELVHNFSLLHDDVMDGDVTRRHRPTAWSVFGQGAAILAGDALLTLAGEVLAKSGQVNTVSGCRILNAAVFDLIDGQAADLAFEERSDVDLSECVRMAEGKTGALLGCASALGATFGGGTEDRIEHLCAFGSRLGLAFQHIDDLLGIWGDPTATGKPVFSDLRNRKKSLPVVAALTSGTAAGVELSALYADDSPLSTEQLQHAADLVEKAGGRSWSQLQAEILLEEALAELHAAHPSAKAADELTVLARLAAHRDR